MELLQKLKEVRRNTLLRSIAIVASGTALAQAITFLFMPLIARLYGPEAFGVQSVFMSFAGILTSIAALTLPMAIVLPQRDEEAYGLAKLSVGIALFVSIFTAIILYLFGEKILELTDSQVIADYLFFLPPFMFLSALSATLAQWLIRKQKFRATAHLGALQALGLNSLKTAAGVFQPTALFLVLANTLGTLLQTLLYLLVLRGESWERAHLAATRVSITRLARAYSDFPLMRAPQVLLNAASTSIPLILLSSSFGPTAAGLYSIAMSALGVPSTLIGNAVSQVFYPKFNCAVAAGHDGRNMLVRTTAAMALAGLPIFGVAAMVSPSLFRLVFGAEWEMAGEYARWLSLWLFFAFINRPSVAALPVLKLQGFFLGFEVVSFITRIVALYIGANVFESELATIICFSIASATINALLIGCTILHSACYNHPNTITTASN